MAINDTGGVGSFLYPMFIRTEKGPFCWMFLTLAKLKGNLLLICFFFCSHCANSNFFFKVSFLWQNAALQLQRDGHTYPCCA
jgi:hypothetical protein